MPVKAQPLYDQQVASDFHFMIVEILDRSPSIIPLIFSDSHLTGATHYSIVIYID